MSIHVCMELYIHVCMYVCMYVYMCMYVCIYIRMILWLYVCMYGCIYVFVFVRLNMSVNVYSEHSRIHVVYKSVNIWLKNVITAVFVTILKWVHRNTYQISEFHTVQNILVLEHRISPLVLAVCFHMQWKIWFQDPCSLTTCSTTDFQHRSWILWVAQGLKQYKDNL